MGHESGGVRQGSDIFAVVFHGILLPGAATDFLNVSERSFEPTLSRQQRCAVGQLGGMHLRTSHDPQRFPDLKPHRPADSTDGTAFQNRMQNRVGGTGSVPNERKRVLNREKHPIFDTKFSTTNCIQGAYMM